MEIKRKQEIVNQYHFDARNTEWEQKNGVPKTKVEVNFHLLKQDYEANSTHLVAVVRFMVVFKDFVVSGGISQENEVIGRVVDQPGDYSQEEIQEISAPVLDMLRRLTYEVTEIAFDAPGINLEF
ncbi:DUF1149 family protein [Streptococcus ovuberis]|uniref:DUF1149 family protein n=1 Tax=Streptococcus ovuberis TaxID=1936207 RepID=A0A7X6MZ05_9STRE|nr:DUF1149 family protein [Streptococcus ovuberis]NKZ20068.1 DUF1149 family protein [Streptococcus ovuberis]